MISRLSLTSIGTVRFFHLCGLNSKQTINVTKLGTRALSTSSEQGKNTDLSGGTKEHERLTSGRSKTRSIVELMRWHKPTGTILTLTPALWSVGLFTPAAAHIPDPKILAIFTAGAIVARGMGCTLNDILDRKYDRHVERTKLRPIACGDITVKEGLVYLSVQSLAGLYILCLNNLDVIKLGLFSGIMIATYPLFKRFTNWPQLMLALTFNWGVLMGYAATKGTFGLVDLAAVLPIYLGANFWTLYYDTIYAHQDKTDDMFIGVKSSAISLGDKTKPFLYLMSGAMHLSLITAGVMTDQIWPYYLSLAGSLAVHGRQLPRLDLDNKEQCWQAFDSQKYVGCLILIGILVSSYYKAERQKDNSKMSNEKHTGDV